MAWEWAGYIAAPVGVLAGTALGWVLGRKDETRRRAWEVEDREHAERIASKQRLRDAQAVAFGEVIGHGHRVIAAAVAKRLRKPDPRYEESVREFMEFVGRAYIVSDGAMERAIGDFFDATLAHASDIVDRKDEDISAFHNAREAFLGAIRAEMNS